MSTLTNDITGIGFLAVITCSAALISNSSSVLTQESKLSNYLASSLIDNLPMIRVKDTITSYYGEQRDIHINLINVDYGVPLQSATLLNRTLGIEYAYLEAMTYPVGGYDITITPLDARNYNPTYISKNMSIHGNHIVRYRFSPSFRSTPLENTVNKFQFEADLDSIASGQASNGAGNTQATQWTSGPVFINTSPIDARIEILEPMGINYTPGMTVNVPQILVKVTAPNHIFIKRWLSLSDGKNIFVAPLKRY
ncbi:hypothetical protein ACNO5E_16370 [Vibrio parahaemolyticus]|uniref:hypothetical protein n=1 Tax=Vibrio parahaemolyticus TaxID=670 RepID=UPI001112638A|nr:hypothetical protein [Vibrio parahaemolyticus]